MPIYDYECIKCGEVEDIIAGYDDQEIDCPKGCGNKAKRLITGSHRKPDEVDWIRSVVDIVDKNGTYAEREFARNPTRENLNRFMKSKGLRHLEPGEGPSKPAEPDMGRVTNEMYERHRKRMAIEVR